MVASRRHPARAMAHSDEPGALDYIKGSYGSPCGAWSHEEATGWY